ncbi:MAG: sporulation transcriptional regulator SpoIIID [Clostridia bacterium]|nr:sporulation transcriptional regulator SpoIIID [Clostridia bacterium]
MKDYIRERAVGLAQYIIEKRATVRDAAKVFDVSKSTVHKDVTQRLKSIDPALCDSVGDVLQVNLSERHLRGGMATKEKYLKQKEK